MKIKISNYPSRLTCNIHTHYMQKNYGYVDWPENQDYFERYLERTEDMIQSIYNVFNWIWFDRRTQKVKVRIDRWDTWSMDHTLAYIILPMLKQLKATKHGAPYVDPKDCPLELKPKKLTKKEKENGHTDSTHFERWDWVLDEMIFAFEQKCRDDWESDYCSGEHDMYFEKITEGEYKGHSEMKRGPKDTFKIDWEGRKAHQERMSNGFRLFGKYYENLWD